MGEVCYLDQATAVTMNNVRELVKVYKGRFDPKYAVAVDKYSAMYKTLLKEVIGSQ